MTKLNYYWEVYENPGQEGTHSVILWNDRKKLGDPAFPPNIVKWMLKRQGQPPHTLENIEEKMAELDAVKMTDAELAVTVHKSANFSLSAYYKATKKQSALIRLFLG